VEQKKIIHFLYCPWTGLGLYNGFRGNRWLRNRIKVFKQFVIPSLKNQVNKNFVLWCGWRREEKYNRYVRELITYLDEIKEFKTIHTFHGVCFWDDKYSDVEARNRLLTSLHGSIGELLDTIGEVDYVYMTIQPSDDCYDNNLVEGIQGLFKEALAMEAFGFTKGYIMDYRTKELAEYNPTTNPPFFTIKFPRDIFIDPLKHANYTGPYKSHEYVGDKLAYGQIDERGFLVGIHGENISTVFNHPFRGRKIEGEEKDRILKSFGISDVPPLKIKVSVRKWLLRKLPHKVQRKLRYLFGEKIFQKFYEFLRG
jgi:hypothetical protein